MGISFDGAARLISISSVINGLRGMETPTSGSRPKEKGIEGLKRVGGVGRCGVDREVTRGSTYEILQNFLVAA